MPANVRSASRLGLRRLGFGVALWCCVFFLPFASAGSALQEQGPEGTAAASAVIQASPPLPPEAPEALSGDIVATGTVSGDIENEEVRWGSLSVSISPEGARTAGAKWSADGGATWKSSGEAILLAAGDAAITFNNLVGWRTPETIPVKIGDESGANAAAEYVPLTGSLRVTIDGPEEARWSVNGRGEHLGGDRREGLVPGEYTISFTDVEGWLKPDGASVPVSAGSIATLSAAYIRTGSVIVRIDGPAEARWSVGDRKNLESGAVVDGLVPGEYAISFSDVLQWEKPEDLKVTLAAGELLRAEGTYAAQSGSGGKKQTARAEVEAPAPGSTNTGEMIGQTPEKLDASASSEEKTPEDGRSPGETPETGDTANPAPEDSVKDADDDDEETVVDVDADNEKEKETETPSERDAGLITNPRPVSEPAPKPSPVPETDPLPPEVVIPTSLLPELTAAERGEIVRSVIMKRQFLDLGDARYASLSTYVPAASNSLRAKSIQKDELLRITGALESLITTDAEGNEAVPVLLRTESFELATGSAYLGGKFLVVRITFTVSHAELAAADPKIVQRIETAVASGRTLGDALLDEIRIFKWIGEGERSRCFDLAERVRTEGFALNSFFEAKTVKRSTGDFFDTKAQDSSYSVAFHLLVFDGSTYSPSRLVQPLEGGRFIVFDGMKDGKYTDPLILAVPRPKNAQKQGSGGCSSVPGGGAGTALLLLPILFVSLRRSI